MRAGVSADTHEPAQEHQGQDQAAGNHVAAQRFDFHLIGVWNDQRTQRERCNDQKSQHPM
jgi:hypothetical protein